MPVTAPPQITNLVVTTNGGNPDTGTNYVYTFTLADSTPGAVIYYSISACGDPPVNGSTNPGQFVFTCSGFGNGTATATMYAIAPGYAQSSSIYPSF